MWIKGFENRYEITKDGRVFSHIKGIRKERKLVPDKNGYMTINIKIDGKVFCKKIHREVGKTYIHPYDGEHINHINGVKCDNRVENLEWCTNLQNLEHMRETGLKPLGNAYVNNSTGYYGVKNSGDKFVAAVKRGNKSIYLGIFPTAEEAFTIVTQTLQEEALGLKVRAYTLKKKIQQIDLNGNVVNTFNSINSAERETKIPNQDIGQVILGRSDTAGGFKWKRIEEVVYI